MLWIEMQSSHGINFYAMTHHLRGEESPDDYINSLVRFLYNEMIIDRRFEKKELKKLFDLVLEVENPT